MTKRYFFALAAILLALITFFGERLMLIGRVTQLTQHRFDAFEQNLARLDRLVDERNRQGEFFRYLGARPGKDPDLAELNPDHRLVETAVVLDRNFTAVARSGRDLNDIERALLRTNERGAVTDTAILRRYLLTDFDQKGIAHLVLAVRPEAAENGAALFAAPFDFSRVAALSPDVFGREENLLLAALLSRQTSDRQIFRLHGVSYVSVRRIFMPESMALFQLTALPPLYAFFSPYLLILVLVSSLVYVLRGHSAARYTRREVSERILHSYGKAIDAQSAALGELSRLTARGPGLQEKLVAGDTRQAEIEERIRREREAQAQQYRKAAPIVIDIMPEERQFRFMNPARTVTPAGAPRRLAEKEQKLRERAFSDELRGLMAAIGEPAAAEPAQAAQPQFIEEIGAFEKKFRYPAIDQYIYYLNELYFDEVTGDELAEAMRVAGDAVQSHDFAILLYDPRAAAFRCGFVRGAPADLMRSLYLLPKDSIIPNDFADYGYVETTAALKKNPFFSKRFSQAFAETLKGIHVFSLAESYLRARILFFDSARGGAIADPDVIATVRTYLRQVAPAVHMFFADSGQAGGNPRDLAEWAVRELRESIALSDPDQPLVISQYVFENSLSGSEQLDLVREISKVLRDGEKVLLMNPSRLIVTHPAGTGREIEGIIGNQGRKFIIKESEFGKASRNLYTFIEF